MPRFLAALLIVPASIAWAADAPQTAGVRPDPGLVLPSRPEPPSSDIVPTGPGLTLRPVVAPAPPDAAGRVALARVFLARGEYTYALGELDAVVKAHPTDAGARAARAEVRLAGHDPGGAAADLLELVRLAPDHPDAHRLLAAVHFGAGRWDDALAAADRAVRAAPDDVRALRGRAEVRAARAEPRSAVADLDRAVRLSPGDPELLARRGELLFQLCEPAEAAADLTRAAALWPTDLSLRGRRAQALIAAGRPAEAIVELDGVAARVAADAVLPVKSPFDAGPSPARPVATAHATAGPVSDFAAARGSDVVPAAAREPARPPVEIQFLRAQAHHKLHEPAKVRRLLDEVLEREPDHLWARMCRGAARFNAGELAGAEEDLAIVAARNPTDANARAAVGYVRIAQGRWWTARFDLDAASALDPAATVVGYLRGPVLSREWRFADAAAAFDEMAKAVPGAAGPVFLRGEARLWAGDFAAAANDLTEAMWRAETPAAWPRAIALRAVAWAGQGEWDRAARELSWAVRVLPADPAAAPAWPAFTLSAPGW